MGRLTGRAHLSPIKCLRNVGFKAELPRTPTGKLVGEFGSYGNFDSQFVSPDEAAHKAGKPIVAVPNLPLGWPTGTAFGTDCIYILDTYHRRIVRANLSWDAVVMCE